MNLGLSGTLVTQSYEQGDGLKMGDGVTVFCLELLHNCVVQERIRMGD